MLNPRAAALTLTTALLSFACGVILSPSAIASEDMALKDGVYLYGESKSPDQLGVTYMTFEVEQGQVTGAVYQHRSSFDCFYGNPQGEQLALTVIDSYSQEQYSHDIALVETETLSASVNRPAAGQIGLDGMSRLEEVSDNNLRMIQMCQDKLGR